MSIMGEVEGGRRIRLSQTLDRVWTEALRASGAYVLGTLLQNGSGTLKGAQDSFQSAWEREVKLLDEQYGTDLVDELLQERGAKRSYL